MKRHWLDIKRCETYVERACSRCGKGGGICGAKVTHVIFLNTPYDKPYVVGSCAKHKSIDGFPFTTLARLNRAIAKLKALKVKPKDFPTAVCILLEPIFDEKLLNPEDRLVCPDRFHRVER